MANLSSARTNAAGEAMTPASYQLTSVLITTNNEVEYDITNLVGEIVVNESLFVSTIETELAIIDGINFFERAKLTGNEKIQIKIGRTEPNNVKKSHEIECYIANIQDFSKPRPGVQVYKFKCISKHAYYNAFKRLNRSFKGSIGSLVYSICIRDLDTYPFKVNRDTKGMLKGIFPHLKPIDAIIWLLRNSTDNSTPFFFYETLKDGLIFDSYESMLNEEVYNTYSTKPFYSEVPNTEENYEEAKTKIIKLSSEFDVGKYFAINDGAYASSVKTLDISTKKYQNNKFNYKNLLKLNNNLPFGTETKFDDEILSNFTDSKIHHISLNKYSHNTRGDNYHKPIAESLAKKQAYHVNLGYMGQDIMIYGDFDISVGKVIELEIYKASDEKLLEEDRKNMIDKMQSGKYLVVSLAHIFDGEEYTIDLGLQKDSSVLNLDEE